MSDVYLGSKLPLSLLCENGATDKYPVAHVFDQNDSEVPGSPFALTHVAYGYYTNYDYTVLASDKRLTAVYLIFDDSLHTEETYELSLRSEDVFDVVQDSSSTDNGHYLVGVLDPNSPDYELVGVVESA